MTDEIITLEGSITVSTAGELIESGGVHHPKSMGTEIPFVHQCENTNDTTRHIPFAARSMTIFNPTIAFSPTLFSSDDAA